MSQSLFSDASQRLDEALAYASISEEAIERLKLPRSSLKVSILVRMDNGELRIFPGYWMRYDDTRAPTKGGIRFDQVVNCAPVFTLIMCVSDGNGGRASLIVGIAPPTGTNNR